MARQSGLVIRNALSENNSQMHQRRVGYIYPQGTNICRRVITFASIGNLCTNLPDRCTRCQATGHSKKSFHQDLYPMHWQLLRERQHTQERRPCQCTMRAVANKSSQSMCPRQSSTSMPRPRNCREHAFEWAIHASSCRTARWPDAAAKDHVRSTWTTPAPTNTRFPLLAVD